MIKALLRTLFIFIITIIATVAFLLTPMGLRFSITVASHFLPGKLTYQKISGVIIGPITVDQLHYQNKGNSFNAEKLYLDWHPLDLRKHEFHISKLDIQNLHIMTDKKATPKKWNEKNIQATIHDFFAAIQGNTFPLHLSIDQTTISPLIISTPTETTNIKKIFFHIILTNKIWDIEFSSVIDKPDHFDVQFVLSGKPTHYTLHFLAKGMGTNWELIGSGNQNTFSVTTHNNKLLDGSLSTQFTLNWKPTLEWQGQLSATKINFSTINKNWPIISSATIHSQGSNSTQLISNTAVHITMPHAQLQLTALSKNTWDIHWHLHCNSFFNLFSHSEINSFGKITGDLANPQLSIQVKGKFHSHYNKIRKINLDLSGDVKKNTLTTTIDFPNRKMQLAMSGGVQDKQWKGTLNTLVFTLAHTNKWTLTQPATLTASPTSFIISPVCLTSTIAGKICLHGQWINKKTEADLNMDITHFGWLSPWTRDVHVPNGRITAHFEMNGTLDNPNITGILNLNNGSIIIPKANITLTHVTTTVVGDGKKLNFKARAISKNEPVTIDGSLDLSQNDFSAIAKLKTTHLLIMNTNQYVIYVTSDLTAKIKDKDVFLTGTIAIPNAIITPNDFQTTTTLPDNDIVYTGIVIQKPAPFWLLHTDAIITIGDHVHVVTSGLDANLGGSIHLTQQPNHDIFATGAITVRKGTYTVYGQKLTISPRSSLNYTNSLLDNPGLNVKATKTIQAIGGIDTGGFGERKLIVGIELHGSVKEPKIIFFSNRSALSQTDILSYLLLGYAGSTNAPGNTELLLRGLSAINITSQGLLGKENIAQQIQSGLGLSEMGVESETNSDATGNPLNRQSAFVVGKHLTRKLYVRYSFGIYSMGVTNPVDVFEIRYLLNKNWMTQVDSSTLGSGADVLYTIQKN